MNYYRTAVLTSWLTVGGTLSALAAMRGAYPLIPIYLAFAVAGGTVPALICAWVLRGICRATGLNWAPLWMLRGGYLSLAYVFISQMVMKDVIGHVAIGSIKGFSCLVLFGPSILMESGYIGLGIVVSAGVMNGIVLHRVSQEDRSPS